MAGLAARLSDTSPTRLAAQDTGASAMKQQRETVLSVEGMTCHSCIRHIDHALKELEGVSHVNVNLREGKVTVRHDDGEAPISALVDSLSDAGYPSRPAE